MRVMMKHAHEAERGFTMVTTILLLAVVTVSALIVLDIVDVDLSMVGLQRRGYAAREAAEGGAMELLNDSVALEDLPDYTTDKLRSEVPVASGSDFGGDGQAYKASVSLVRIVPLAESSQSRVNAIVYSLDVTGQGSGSTRAGVQAEIYRIATSRNGVIRPTIHGR